MRKYISLDQVNKQLQAVLDQYHIAIPADAALTFTITPIDYQVKVSGTDDEQLIHQIEQILQSGENSKQLFLHIMKSLSKPIRHNIPKKRTKNIRRFARYMR